MGSNKKAATAAPPSKVDITPEMIYNLSRLAEQSAPLLQLLENRKSVSQNAPGTGSKGVPDMTKRHKQRVKIGVNQNGEPVYKWVDGYSIDELNDNIVKVYVEYGLIDRFTVGKPAVKNGVCPTFLEYTSKWFETYKVPTLRHTTVSGYRSNLKIHIYPFFGKMRLDEITTESIQQFMNERAHLARNTMHTMLVLVSEALQSAYEDGLIPSNPAVSKRLTNPAKGKKVRDALTAEQYRSIRDKVGSLNLPDERRLLALLLYTGMRRGEVLGLRWEDIDFGKKLIHVNRSVTLVTNQPSVGETKTNSGKRIIPFDDKLTELLKPLGSDGYVIGGKEPVTDMVFRRLYRNIEKQINIFGATPHIFRHTYITMLAKSGLDLKTVQRISGHADISTTLNIYTHVHESEIQSAGEKIGKLLDA